MLLSLLYFLLAKENFNINVLHVYLHLTETNTKRAHYTNKKNGKKGLKCKSLKTVLSIFPCLGCDT